MKAIARVLVVTLVIVVATAFGMRWWAHSPVRTPGDAAIEVDIAPGSSVRSIGLQYQAAGIPMNPLLFVLLARVEGRATRLRAGAYAIDGALSPHAILDKMESGDVARVSLVVPEGWTFAQMRAAIAARPDIRQTTASLGEAALMKALGAPTPLAEGQFFPDTYLFTRGTTDLDLYRRAYQMQQKRLADAWAARAPNLPLATPYEALILASIVEKETGRAEDRPQVAAVFVNRLRRGMLLQTDPAVIYGMGERFDGNLRKPDLVRDSPYNTYLRTGLPPTPIALPGAASLAAVLNPPRSDALYFVARGDGSSVFSPSLDAHNRAVNRFQKEPARRGSQAP